MPTPHDDVPLCDLRASFRSQQADIEAAVSRVLASGQVINGPEVEGLEREVAEYCGTAHGVGCSSGSDALSLAIAALGIGPGDEVIVPPFTFFATVGAVCRAGATPVFADIDPATYNIDPLQIENKITPRTRAVMVVHLFGQAADMEPIWRVASRNGLPVIEDAAQSLGAEYQGKRVGSLGAMACLSFYPTKILGTFGDGGMVVTGDPDWAARMTILRGHGMRPKYHHPELGWNARLDALHAAILRVRLPMVERWVEMRRAAARRYDELIEAHHLGRFLQRPVARPNRRHVFNQYVVRVGNGQRDALVRHLKADRVATEVYYPVPLHLQGCLSHLGHGPGDFPAAEEACRAVLALPMFPELAAEQQERVVASCGEFLRRQTRRAA